MPKYLTRRFSKALGTAAISAILMTSPLSAQHQPGQPKAKSGSYHLLELTVDTQEVTAEQFQAETRAIRSCEQAKEVGERLEAGVKRVRFYPHSNLPKPLQMEMKNLPNGHATQIFAGPSDTMRVLVICSRV